jgi:hypothetical protein
VAIPPIVIWVPGTSNHAVNPAFAQALPDDITPVLVDYMATWQLTESVPDGVKNLQQALRAAQRRRKKGQRILLAGESQGAWVISQTLTDSRYVKIVDGAVLLGNPGTAPLHFGKEGSYREIDHRFDFATFKWTDSPLLPKAITDVMSGSIVSDVTMFASILIRHPLRAAVSGFLLLKELPLLDKIIPDPHDYSGDMATAVAWLLEE